MTISTKIRNLRTIKGYSQENMAQMLNLSLNSYAKIERDEVKTTTGRLEQIAKVLGVKIVDILSFGENAQQNIYMGEVKADFPFDQDFIIAHEKLKIENEAFKREVAHQ